MDDPKDNPTDPTSGAEATDGQMAATRPSRSEPPDTGTPPSRSEPPDTGAPSRDQMTVAFTPSQLAVGGAIVAGLLVVGARILLGRRRGRG